MSIPTFDQMLHPILAMACEKDLDRRTAAKAMVEHFRLTPDESEARIPSGKSTFVHNRAGWAMTFLTKGGLIAKVAPKTYRATEAGKDFLARHRHAITVKDLQAIEGWEELWRKRDDGIHDTASGSDGGKAPRPLRVLQRLAARAARRRDPEAARHLLEKLYPKLAHRRAAIELLADAIDHANAIKPNIWGTTLRAKKINFNVGRVLACGLYTDQLKISVCPEAIRAIDLVALEAAGAERVQGQPFKLIPEATAYWVRSSTLEAVRAHLQAGLDCFIERASRVSKKLPHEDKHSPGVLRYLEIELGRVLPRPSYAPPDDAPPEVLSPRFPTMKAVAVVEPRVQFTERRYDVDGLLKYIELGDIALPDIQRPFVWKSTKVRDLFDSMYRGFPVGSLMLWATPGDSDTKAIGVEDKQRIASLLVVDGQQRLTSLYAVLRGKPVLDDNFEEIHLEIGFRPRDGYFEVTDAAIRRDPEYVPDISQLWTSNKPSRRIINEFLETLRSKRDLSHDDEDAISHNLDRLFDLTKYPFTTLEIAKDVNEEAVADIFVRINNGGSKLGQSDFILTLLSVFSPQTRRALEDFSRRATIPPSGKEPSPFNHLIKPAPDQLVRVGIAVGFYRARLSAVYQLLRGKDPDTGTFVAARREQQFRRLEDATPMVLDLTHWHLFITCLVGAGFRSEELISSENAVLNSYALYLIGKLRYAVEEKTLGRLIGRWFFMASLSGRYSGSSETIMEEDLSQVRDLPDASAFVSVLEATIRSVVTNDFWETTVPHELETSSVNSPAARAYLAAQIKLGAPILFSDRRIADLYDPTIQSHRRAIEGHHLFPRNWLRAQGIENTKHINQAANLAFVEWPDNAAVSDTSPADYVPRLRRLFAESTWDTMCAMHALPLGWETMPYDGFLRERRKLMARIIRRGFEALTSSDSSDSSEADGRRFAAADEKRAWSLIEELELELRKVLRTVYDTKWGGGADARIQKILSPDEVAAIDSHKAKHAAAYPLSRSERDADLLDYFYLGQLVKIVQSNDVWPEFKDIFKDKGQLQQTIGAIAKVRNDRAHFRAVPEKELQRCVLACDDLLTLLRRMDAGRAV